ncbi:hypothetical protein KCU81_g362, partial [Aureobasidium melanogenum]
MVKVVVRNDKSTNPAMRLDFPRPFGLQTELCCFEWLLIRCRVLWFDMGSQVNCLSRMVTVNVPNKTTAYRELISSPPTRLRTGLSESTVSNCGGGTSHQERTGLTGVTVLGVEQRKDVSQSTASLTPVPVRALRGRTLLSLTLPPFSPSIILRTKPSLMRTTSTQSSRSCLLARTRRGTPSSSLLFAGILALAEVLNITIANIRAVNDKDNGVAAAVMSGKSTVETFWPTVGTRCRVQEGEWNTLRVASAKVKLRRRVCISGVPSLLVACR